MTDNGIDEALWNYYMFSERGVFSKNKGDKEKPQARAFAFADARGGLPVFGKHVAEKNYHYHSCGWETFFGDYVKTDSNDRLFLEVIREHVPVNFYIDAELFRNVNPEFGPGSEKELQILEEAKRVCFEGLVRCFPHVPKEDIEMWEMDASDAKKLSRHFVFRIKGKALANFLTAGVLYNEIAKIIPKESILYVKDDRNSEGDRILFLDGSVYTKNRQFRMYQSRKFGNYRFLCIPGFDKPGDVPNIEKLKGTLITYFPPAEKTHLTLLELKGDGTKRKRKANGPRSSKKRALDDPDKFRDNHWLIHALSSMFDCESYKQQMEEDGTTIMYLMSSKQCEIFGAEHDGNHIKYLVNLVSKTYAQYCFARSCEGKTGESRPVPEKYHASIDKYMKEERDRFKAAAVFQYDPIVQ